MSAHHSSEMDGCLSQKSHLYGQPKEPQKGTLEAGEWGGYGREEITEEKDLLLMCMNRHKTRSHP